MRRERLRRKERFPVLLRITNRILFFFASASFAFALLYVVGNFRQFLDSNQQLILFCCSIVSCALIIISVFALIQYTLFWVLSGALPRMRYYFVYLLLIAYSVSAAVLARLVLFAAGEAFY